MTLAENRCGIVFTLKRGIELRPNPLLMNAMFRFKSMLRTSPRRAETSFFPRAAAVVFAVAAALGARAADPDVVVAADGSGRYKTIREAIDAAPALLRDEGRRWKIFVKNGIYREFVYVQREKRFITLVGEDAGKTVLMYDLYAGLPGLDEKPMGMFRTPTLTVDADDFTLENITVENFAGSRGQAIALRADGDRVIFRRCHFLGFQNVVLVNRGRQFFQDCVIRGAMDLVFGGATAFFEHCEIQIAGPGAIAAASTPDIQPHGLVFSYCKITGAAGTEAQTVLGRPWRDFAKTVFLNTEMSAVVQPAGWDNWRRPRAEKTVDYAEFNSTGPGGAAAARVPWAKQLTETEAAKYSMENVLGGADNWNPLRVPEPEKPAKKKKKK